jgi:hypothetical protein
LLVSQGSRLLLLCHSPQPAILFRFFPRLVSSRNLFFVIALFGQIDQSVTHQEIAVAPPCRTGQRSTGSSCLSKFERYKKNIGEFFIGFTEVIGALLYPRVGFHVMGISVIGFPPVGWAMTNQGNRRHR